MQLATGRHAVFKTYTVNPRSVRMGIQIGEHGIQIREHVKDKTSWRLDRVITVDIPEGLIKNGQILHQEAFVKLIRETFQTYPFRTKKFAVFVEDLPFFMRHVELPDMPKREIEQAILLKAQVEFPIHYEDLVIRYYPYFTKQANNTNTSTQYVIIAVNRALIDSVVSAMHLAGLSITAFALEPVILYRGLKRQDFLEKTQSTTLLVKVDQKRILHSIFQAGKFVYSRYLPATNVQDMLQQEIERTIISWKSTQGNLPVEQVVLLGVNDHFKMLSEEIASYMNVSVQTVELGELAAYGESIRQPKRLNFYSDRLVPWQNKKTMSYLGGGILSLFLLSSIVYPFSSRWVVQHDIAFLRTHIQQSGVIEQLLMQKNQLVAMEQADLQQQKTIHSKNINPLSILDVVNHNKPQSIAFSQITFTSDQLHISGNASSQNDVIEYLDRLQQNPNLKNVQLTHSDHGANEVLFTIDCKSTLTDGDLNHE